MNERDRWIEYLKKEVAAGRGDEPIEGMDDPIWSDPEVVEAIDAYLGRDPSHSVAAVA